MATNVGRVGIVTKGIWSNTTSYETLDAVGYNGGTYIAKQNVPANTLPTNTTYWQEALGIVNQTLDISNIALVYDSAGSTAPTATLNTTNGASAIIRSGNTIIFMLIFSISAVGSGNTLKVTGLPVIPTNYRTLVTAAGPSLAGSGYGIIRKDASDIIIYKGNGDAVNSSNLATGNVFIGGTYVIS